MVLEKRGCSLISGTPPCSVTLPAHTNPYRILGRLRSWQQSRLGQPSSHKHDYKRLVVIPVPSRSEDVMCSSPNVRIASPKQDLQGPEIHRNPVPQCSPPRSPSIPPKKTVHVLNVLRLCFTCVALAWSLESGHGSSGKTATGHGSTVSSLEGSFWPRVAWTTPTCRHLMDLDLWWSMGISWNLWGWSKMVQMWGPFQNLEGNCLRLLTCNFNLLFPLWT